MLKDFEIKKVSSVVVFFFRDYIKQIDSMLPCVCAVIDRRRRQNVVRTSVPHSPIASRANFLFLPHFDVICDRYPGDLFCANHRVRNRRGW